jgi:TAT (twin-arginine translocation) pathway-exported protein
MCQILSYACAVGIREGGMNDLKRRDFLKASAALAGAAAASGFSCVEIASAAPIEVIE